MIKKNLNKKFNHQYQQGTLGEKLIGIFLTNRFGFKLIKYNYDGRYDILMKRNGKEVHFEVKTDRYSYFKKDTNNMFIETSYKGNLSGPWKSIAKYFIYYLPDKKSVYIIKMSDLKELFKRPEVAHYTSSAGDNGWSSGFLIDLDIAKLYFKLYYY